MLYFTRFDQILATHLNATHTPAPSVPKSLAGPVRSAVTAVISRAAIIVAGGVPVIRSFYSGADEGADSEAADHAGRDRAAVARFSRLRGGDGCEPKGRGGRESSECSGLGHGAPSFGSLRSEEHTSELQSLRHL